MNVTLRWSPRLTTLLVLLVCSVLLAATLLLALHPAIAAPQNVAMTVDLPVKQPVRDCSDLQGIDLSGIGGAGSRVTKVGETTSNGTAVCSVEGTLAPSISFRVDLPTGTWTQRYMQLGCGGLCGRLSLQVGVANGCPTFEAGGFVFASTDMGHEGQDTAWGKDPQKRVDFAYRSLHLTALAAKALIRRFYGQAERFSYFNGCSDGGREALVMAQRFPDDFNGIIAGAAAMNFQVQNSLYHGWQARSNTGADGKPILLAPRLPILHRAVVAACDTLDGQKDGLISAPSLCHFDPVAVQCEAGTSDTAQCLTAAEVEVARKFYAGPRDAQTGERLTVGAPQFGSELAWAGVYVPQAAGQPIFSSTIAMQAMQHLIFENDAPATLADLQFTRATFDRLRPRHPLYDATNPDLSAFAARGGKLILWHGWADPQISPINTIAYHEAVRRQMGVAKADSFERLYLLPGVYHCSGGEGPSLIDLVTPIMAWVERGAAPDALLTRQDTSTHANGFGQPVAATRSAAGAPSAAAPVVSPNMTSARAPVLARSRPVYPYPYIAEYKGSGDPNAASSYRRGKPLAVASIPAWTGADFYEPYAPRLH
ncbi:MAG: tannase/feruloyl esterase family alpha/beta hydrolase [Janthinobacterium lividum]